MDVLWWGGLAFACLPAGYLALLTAGAVGQRLRRPKSSGRLLGHAALIIAARNEADFIGGAVHSLSTLLDGNGSVHVIADNCSDDTAARAREALAQAGAPGQVWVRDDPHRQSKGGAIAWALPRVTEWTEHRGGTVAFFGFFDADARVSPNSLVLAREGFGRGAFGLQSEYQIRGDATWKQRLVTVAVSANNITRGLGRLFFGMGDFIKGNGFWLKAESLQEVPWQAFSATEDLEYSLRLALAGKTVTFLPDSLIVSAVVQGRAREREQRVRWESGKWHLVRRHGRLLWRAMVNDPCTAVFHLCWELVTPPLALLAAGYGVLVLVSPWPQALLPLGALGILALHGAITVWVTRLPVRYVFSLLGLPLYVVWKLALLPQTWRRSRAPVWDRAPEARDKKAAKN